MADNVEIILVLPLDEKVTINRCGRSPKLGIYWIEDKKGQFYIVPDGHSIIEDIQCCMWLTGDDK